ncbi:MAG: hypothetical protein GY699_05300 [Desulfobacteraceae bacterium]|nr:hypothetical protein [Desulfobacteraceae bacterium]
MGDTGPDELEKAPTTKALWEKIVPLIKQQQLRVIYIESSYQDEQPDNLLFGHLTPVWIMKAFRELACMITPDNVS